jgi:putative permease
VVIIILGNMLAPVLASMVLAYLLEGLVNFLEQRKVPFLEQRKVPRLVAVLLVFMTFVIFVLFLLLKLFPLLWTQVGQLFQELPSMVSWSQRELMRLPERYPDLISEQQVMDIIDLLRSEIATVGQRVLSISVASVRGIISILVYIFLVPLLVFFFLKDKDGVLRWFTRFLPADRTLAAEVWQEVDQQIGNYVRGKFWEILIVWAASYVTFAILGLQFAMLISLFVGLSVLIPYIGAVLMVIPVALIGYFQWGLGSDLLYAVAAYVLIQILDGNVLVTLLFSEVVNIHPVAIIVAVLVFGGLWGFWGVFFAIPLATLVHAIIKALARRPTKDSAASKEGAAAETTQPDAVKA